MPGLKCWFGVTVNTSGGGGTGTSNSSAATGTGNFNINDFFNKTLKECDNTTTKACTITGSLLELLAIYQRSCTIMEKAPTRHGDTMVNKR